MWDTCGEQQRGWRWLAGACSLLVVSALCCPACCAMRGRVWAGEVHMCHLW